VKQSHKSLLVWVVIIVAFLTVWQFFTPTERKAQVAFSDFISEVQAGRVDEIRIKDRDYIYRLRGTEPGKPIFKEAFGPAPDEKLLQTLRESKDSPKVFFEKDEQSPFWSSTILTVIPMIFLILMFFLFMRQLQAGGGKAMSFGKSKARMLSDAQNKITFADVAGVEEAKDEVEEIIAFLKDLKKF